MIDIPEKSRRYDIDFLRVFAFILLILYHVSQFYAEGEGWHAKSIYQTHALDIPRLLVNQWRMSLLFIISGLAISFVWHRYTAGKFAIQRTRRLLVPLLFGMAFIVAPQCYYEALGKGLIEPGFIKFMGQYLTFHDFPDESWAGEAEIHWTWNHLWYLPYVWLYTLLLIPIAGLLDGPLRSVRRWFQGLRGASIVLVPMVPLMIYGNFVFPRFPYISHALLDDWYAHVMYFTFFLIGYMIGRDAGFWAELARIRKVTLALASTTFVLFILRNEFLPDDPPFLLEQASFLITYLNRWLWIVTIFGWGHYLFNRPMKYLPYATEAVFSWYILHQTITVVVGYQLTPLALGPVVEPVLVLIATFGGCFVIHEFLIRRSRILRPLFGLK
ncbi:MAG: acyltransferase family protein [Gammaproteobacteria bacterium]|nr:acyltransferase family protein [Gammaproteobacteria bacterium]MDH5239563.1 acyltransferase family protein [Gammaproteobacteria bacterium]MDH5261275.1 acyltransferase family protein [Gammaproteobacteria bacterium]MDH5583227.1 acyltransferase family protein [Gammaproteobacteria bacterium]